jgi:citrate synthase
MTLHQTTAGLDGVTAAMTALSHVDGEGGELIIAGSRVAQLAAETDFEGLPPACFRPPARKPQPAN